MLVKTQTRLGEASDVRWMEGVVSLGQVRLNVIAYFIDGVLIDTSAAQLLKDF